MSEHELEIHIIADSTGETAARSCRAAQAQFPDQVFRIVRHPRVSTADALFRVFDVLRVPGAHPRVVIYTLVNEHMRELVGSCCEELAIPNADLMGPVLRAFETVTGRAADQVPRRPVGVEADYFVRIAAMEFAIRNDDGVMPQALYECDICLVGASRSGKTPLSIYLGYLGYRAVNVPLVPGIEPPRELFAVDRWRIVGLTIDAERLLAIRRQRMKQDMGTTLSKNGYADILAIYDELDEITRIQRRLACPIIDTTGLALEEAAVRVIDVVDERARRVGARLRSPAGSSPVISP